MGDPPSKGAVHEMVDCWFWLDAARTEIGAPGVAPGVAGADREDAGPVPRTLMALTWNT